MGAWVPERKRMGLVGFGALKYVCFRSLRHTDQVNAPITVQIANISSAQCSRETPLGHPCPSPVLPR